MVWEPFDLENNVYFITENGEYSSIESADGKIIGVNIEFYCPHCSKPNSAAYRLPVKKGLEVECVNCDEKIRLSKSYADDPKEHDLSDFKKISKSLETKRNVRVAGEREKERNNLFRLRKNVNLSTESAKVASLLILLLDLGITGFILSKLSNAGGFISFSIKFFGLVIFTSCLLAVSVFLMSKIDEIRYNWVESKVEGDYPVSGYELVRYSEYLENVEGTQSFRPEIETEEHLEVVD